MADLEFLIVNVGKESFGISIQDIKEIIKTDQKVTQIPRTQREILGILKPREKTLVVIDIECTLFGRLSSSRNCYSEDSQNIVSANYIISEINDRGYAWLVNSVSDIIKITNEEMKSIPRVLDSSQRYLKGVFKYEDKLIQVLDLESLIRIIDRSA